MGESIKKQTYSACVWWVSDREIPPPEDLSDQEATRISIMSTKRLKKKKNLNSTCPEFRKSW